MTHKTHTLDSLRTSLTEAGFSNFYTHKDGYLIVKESDAVKVQINLSPRGIVTVHTKFPQIGSSVQVISTFLLLILGFLGILPYPVITAVLLGQIISILWFQPKINNLKKEIEIIIS